MGLLICVHDFEQSILLKFMTSYSGALSLAQHEKPPSLDELIGILALWEK